MNWTVDAFYRHTLAWVTMYEGSDYEQVRLRLSDAILSENIMMVQVKRDGKYFRTMVIESTYEKLAQQDALALLSHIAQESGVYD